MILDLRESVQRKYEHWLRQYNCTEDKYAFFDHVQLTGLWAMDTHSRKQQDSTEDVSTSNMYKLRVELLRAYKCYNWTNKIEVVLRGKSIWIYVDPNCRQTASAEDKLTTQNPTWR